MMPQKGYVSVTIPKSLVEAVKTIIEQKEELGYASSSEFIKDAIRRHIEHCR